MKVGPIATVIFTSCTSKLFSLFFSFSSPQSAAAFTNIAEKSGEVSDTPLSPSHAGDKGAFTYTVGLRLVDIVVLPRPSVMEEGKAAVSAPSKRPFYSLRRTKTHSSDARGAPRVTGESCSTKNDFQSLAAGDVL